MREPLDELRAASAHHTAMTLTLALSYGGRESIARAVRAAVQDAVDGKLAPDEVDVDCFARYLPTSQLPPVDLLIRTSGEQRISNFMLWEIAYAELMFVDVQWPEFRRQHLYDCLDQYAQRERRFGLTGDQLASDVEPP